MNSANAQEIARQIGAFASSHGCLRVLCDYSRTRIADSILGLYENPVRMEKSGLPRTLKIAVYYRRDEQKHRFWETVFRNRGYMLRAFRDRNDAVRWLLDRYRY